MEVKRQSSLRNVLRQIAVLPPLHVETLDFLSRRSIVRDLDRSVLLLLEEEESLEDGVEVDLEKTVLVVDLLLEEVRHLDGLVVVGDVRVDEDRIGISVDHLEEEKSRVRNRKKAEEERDEELTSS